MPLIFTLYGIIPNVDDMLSCWMLPLYVFIVIDIILYCARFKEKKKELSELAKLQDTIREYIFEFINTILYQAGKKLDFGKEYKNNERISLYMHVNHEKKFIPLGRASYNPEYREKGRYAYPDNQGCIAQGWQNGWYFDNKFPNYDKNADGYIKRGIEEYHIAEETCKKITMKSRLFAVWKITKEEKDIVVPYSDLTVYYYLSHTLLIL